MKNEIKGFTLAETMIVIIVLGIIATLTIPALVNKQREAVARTKVRKAMSAYDLAIQKMTIENDLKSDTALISWAGNQDNNCANSTQYFKKTQDINGCTFKTSDGLWWNISDITHPVISLKKIDENTEGQTLDDIKTKADNQNDLTAFYLVTTYNPETGAFRTDDLAFEEQRDNTSADYLRVKKLYMLTKGIKSNRNSDTPTVDVCHTGIQSRYIDTDYEGILEDIYDNNGKLVSRKIYDYWEEDYPYSGEEKYEYDKDGNLTNVKTYNDDGSLSGESIYEYNKNGEITNYKSYNDDGSLGWEEKYEYDSNGNLTLRQDCGDDGGCWKHYFDYDSSGKMLYEHSFNPDGSVEYNKEYVYDGDGSITTYEYVSNGKLQFEQKYGSKGNEIYVKYYDVNNESNNLLYNFSYAYDEKGNKISCKKWHNNDTEIPDEIFTYKNEYDRNGNIINVKTHYINNNDGREFTWDDNYQYDNCSRMIKNGEHSVE